MCIFAHCCSLPKIFSATVVGVDIFRLIFLDLYFSVALDVYRTLKFGFWIWTWSECKSTQEWWRKEQKRKEKKRMRQHFNDHMC